jgi:hypothetical protein
MLCHIAAILFRATDQNSNIRLRKRQAANTELRLIFSTCGFLATWKRGEKAGATLSEQGGQCWNWRDHRIERQGGCGHQGKARGEVNALPGEKPHAVTTAHGDDPLPAPAGRAGYARTPLPWIPHRPNRGQGARCRTEASKLPVRGARVKLASSTARSCGHPG